MFCVNIFTMFLALYTRQVISVRITRLFQLIDGYNSETSLRGFLHVGNEYAVYLRVPEPNDRVLRYELYEANNDDELRNYRPRLLAVSEVPIRYLKDQLKTFRSELHTYKHVSSDHVPGILVQSLREWQLEQVLKRDSKEILRPNKPLYVKDDE